MSEQYYKVRAQPHCVACGKDDKAAGLVLHWQCHSKQKARNDGDYSKAVKRKLDKLEASL